MTDTDVLVVGAGIVGLATAAAIQERQPGAQVTVFDKEAGPARHQSGRNSGVVHAGLYYPPGSAKTALVARGRRQLAAFCRVHELPIEWCGKVVVATRVAQLHGLEQLRRRAEANGVRADRLSLRDLYQLEPHVRGLAGLHVPSTGITDFGAVASTLAAVVRDGGGELRFGREVTSVRTTADGRGLRVTAGGHGLTTRRLVNCAGLHSDRIARLAGCGTDVTILPFRGEYHRLSDAAVGLVQNLVYPVPDPRWPFLGVHFTRMLSGGVHVGPNAVLSLGRERYDGGVDRRGLVELARSNGLRRLAAQHWRTGVRELVAARSKRGLARQVRELVPEVRTADLLPAGSGIRAQAIRPDGTLLEDFEFATSPHAIHVLNAPSPAATASLAIGELIAERLDRLD